MKRHRLVEVGRICFSRIINENQYRSETVEGVFLGMHFLDDKHRMQARVIYPPGEQRWNPLYFVAIDLVSENDMLTRETKQLHYVTQNWIESTGGGVLVDMLELWDGRVIGLNDEGLCVYDNAAQLYDGDTSDCPYLDLQNYDPLREFNMLAKACESDEEHEVFNTLAERCGLAVLAKEGTS